MSPQRVRVYELGPSTNFKIDSFYTLRNQYFTDYAGLLGSKDFFPYQLDDSVKTFEDTTTGQLRIRLNNSFGQRLLNYDTTNAYASGSAFKTNFRGFAIEADQSFGNALMAFGLVDNANTKLAIYYNYIITFTPPEVVFLDVYDSTLGDYKLTPYDFETRKYGQQSGSYGSFGKSTADNAGNTIRVWEFNITSYVQNILTQKEPLHNFGLMAAIQVTDRYRANYIQNTGDYIYYQTGLNPQFAFGRVRVGGGNHATQRMRLRII